MSFTPKKLSVAVMVALGVASLAQAQTATTEKTVITGSNIKRVDAEPVAPVDIITREEIERTGRATVAEVLRNMPSNTGGSFSESFANSFAPGASGISLRGLGQKSTLVLINGRRTNGYGFAQNISDTFVDLNSIPSAAVERIEVLKDGASAIYGSDAIAGVVNVILRRDFRGAEVAANAGRSEGKNEYRFNLTGGLGDVGKDRYNVFGVFDYYKRDLLTYADTEFGKTRDRRGETGGRNHQSLEGGGTWRQLTAAGALTSVRRATTDCPGTVLTAAEAVDRGLISSVLGNANLNLPGNTFCTYDFDNQFTALPKTERFGFLGRGTFDFSPTVQGYAELGLSRVDIFQPFQSAFFAGSTVVVPPPAPPSVFIYNIAFAPGVAGNPFNTPARYSGVLNGIGLQDTDQTSDTGRILAGVKYTFAGWDGDSAIGYAKNKIESTGLNSTSLSRVSAVFNVPATRQPPIPLSNATSYNLDRWTLNSDAVRNSVLTDFLRTAESKLAFADTKLSTEFGNLPGGPIGVAAGVEFRNEKLSDRPDVGLESGDILNRGSVAVDGSRDSYAAFAEFALPITRQLEAQAAVRYDHYSDFGSATTPKFGLKLKAAPWLLLRANWGRGFRAPTLPEISQATASSFQQVGDPNFQGALANVAGITVSNPGLAAEKSTSTTIGIVFEPSPNFNMALNLYEVDWRNQVVRPSAQQIVNEGGPGVIRDPVTGTIIYVIRSYLNQASTITRGADFDLRYRLSTAYGRFTTRLNATYVDTYKEDGVEFAGTNGGFNATVPRVKGTLSLDYDNGPIATTLAANYIHHYWQYALPGSFFTPQDPRFQNGVYPDQIPRYITYDFYAKYNVTKNLAITGAVINFTDKLPPYDPGFSTTDLYSFELYDIRGRQVRLGLEYKM